MLSCYSVGKKKSAINSSLFSITDLTDVKLFDSLSRKHTIMNNAYTINFGCAKVTTFVAVGSACLDARINLAPKMFLSVRQCV